MRETWKKVRRWPYRVSTLGRVQRITGGPGTYPGKILKPLLGSGGYLSVVLSDSPRMCCIRIHRLVLEAFRGLRSKGMECRHGVGGKLDNRLVNLRWGARSKNMGKDMLRDGTLGRGEQNPHSKLNRKQILKARASVGKITQASIARELGVSQSHIAHIIARKCWIWL